MTPMTRRSTSAIALTVAALLVGCGGDSTGPSPRELAGTYDLTSVNERSTPAPIDPLVSDEGQQLATTTVLGGLLTMREDGTYRLTVTFRFSGIIVYTASSSDNGTYTVRGNTVTFSLTDSDGERYSYTGTIAGARISAVIDDNTYVWSRQP